MKTLFRVGLGREYYFEVAESGEEAVEQAKKRSGKEFLAFEVLDKIDIVNKHKIICEETNTEETGTNEGEANTEGNNEEANTEAVNNEEGTETNTEETGTGEENNPENEIDKSEESLTASGIFSGETEFAKLKKAELLEIAKERQIETTEEMTKKDIISLILSVEK